MRFLDRSRIEQDWRCPRARFWAYEFQGRGVAPARGAFDLEYGTIVHTCVELALTEGAEQAGLIAHINTAEMVKRLGGDDADAQQWAAIAQGSVQGFMRAIWTVLAPDYELISVERELTLTLADDLVFQARPDLLLRHRGNGGLWYFELKTTGFVGPQWLQSWHRAPQLQLGAIAAEQELGESLAGCYVVGLYKGRKGRDGRQDSPFAWGWRNAGIPGVVPEQFSYDYQRAKGWARFPSHEAPGGVAGWVERMPAELLAQQFAISDPIFLRRDMTEALLRQTVEREREIRAAMAEMGREGVVTPTVLDRAFRQHFFNCEPAFGHACQFKDACWIPWIGRDPIASGQFEWREAHHEAEAKFFKSREEAEEAA